jgi:hypothetical protein
MCAWRFKSDSDVLIDTNEQDHVGCCFTATSRDDIERCFIEEMMIRYRSKWWHRTIVADKVSAAGDASLDICRLLSGCVTKRAVKEFFLFTTLFFIFLPHFFIVSELCVCVWVLGS